MNAQYFIDKLTPIPDDQWITGQLCDSQGRCCVLGHCGERRGVYEWSEESFALQRLFSRLVPASLVNDRKYGVFQQETPKARILAALEYIKSLTNIPT